MGEGSGIMNDIIYFLKNGSKQPARLDKKIPFRVEYGKQIILTGLGLILFVFLIFLIF